MNRTYKVKRVLDSQLSAAHLLLLSILSVCWQQSAYAENKLDAQLFTKESMQEHSSDEPRKLVHDMLANEFAKGSIIRIVNPENSRDLMKYRPAAYVIGANLIAFSFKREEPFHVSLSVQLLSKSTGKVLLTSDRMVLLDKRVVESGLKLHRPEFDKSEYGKALVVLSRLSAKAFEEQVKKLNL